MKLLILSDSHRKMEYMYRAVEQEQPDLIIHLGDHDRDAERLSKRYPEIPLWSVSGNCDYGAGPERIVQTLEGVRIYATHGHTLRVKYGLLRAELAAREAEANLLLFGHTHRPLCDWHNGLWMLNPGTCSGMGQITYGVIELNNGEVRPYIFEIE
jgi:hypothetical protein